VNFAIKTGALRDFLDNSAVPYQTADAGDRRHRQRRANIHNADFVLGAQKRSEIIPSDFKDGMDPARSNRRAGRF
jgi:hypothetical protein